MLSRLPWIRMRESQQGSRCTDLILHCVRIGSNNGYGTTSKQNCHPCRRQHSCSRGRVGYLPARYCGDPASSDGRSDDGNRNRQRYRRNTADASCHYALRNHFHRSRIRDIERYWYSDRTRTGRKAKSVLTAYRIDDACFTCASFRKRSLGGTTPPVCGHSCTIPNYGKGTSYESKSSRARTDLRALHLSVYASRSAGKIPGYPPGRSIRRISIKHTRAHAWRDE